MLENFRQFEATDPFGGTWTVVYLWIQNAISIRHADAIDVKFELTSADGEHAEKFVALPHPLLLELSRETSRPITDSWVARLAAGHLKQMIETGNDMDKTLITVTEESIHRRDADPQRKT